MLISCSVRLTPSADPVREEALRAGHRGDRDLSVLPMAVRFVGRGGRSAETEQAVEAQYRPRPPVQLPVNVHRDLMLRRYPLRHSWPAFGLAGHQVRVLHRLPGGAFAEVVDRAQRDHRLRSGRRRRRRRPGSIPSPIWCAAACRRRGRKGGPRRTSAPRRGIARSSRCRGSVAGREDAAGHRDQVRREGQRRWRSPPMPVTVP